MMYRYLLIDNDNTLMDFHAAEHHALRAHLRQCGVEDIEAAAALYKEINDSLWAALERGETTLPVLKTLRFRRLLDALGRENEDAETMARGYERELGKCGFLLPGAEDFLRRVSARMPVALVTNGVSNTQRGRLSGSPLTPMLSAIIISEEVGVSKPDARMAELALTALGCHDPREAVLLGDSLSADVGCARAAGIDSIWLAPEGKTSPLPTRVVHSLAEAEHLLLGDPA